jgi:hypothetical protein
MEKDNVGTPKMYLQFSSGMHIVALSAFHKKFFNINLNYLHKEVYIQGKLFFLIALSKSMYIRCPSGDLSALHIVIFCFPSRHSIH